jgi:hypothetical protein
MNKTLLSGLAAAAAMASFPYASEAQLQLQQVWALQSGDPATPYLGTSSNERGLAYNPATGHLLIPTRANLGLEQGSVNIATVNATTGAFTGYLDMTGVVTINQVAVTADGVIYGQASSAAAADPNFPFRIYRWENQLAAPTLVFSGDPSGGVGGTQFWGNSFAIRGTGANTQILALNTTDTSPAVSGPITGAVFTTSNETSFTANPFAIDAGPTTAIGLVFGEGDTFFATRGGNVTTSTSATRQRPLYEFSFDLLAGTATELAVYGASVMPLQISPIAMDFGNGLLAGIITNTNDQTNAPAHTVYLYDWNTKELLDTHAMPGRNTGAFVSNGNQVGQLAFGPDGWLWALETNNGLAGFQIIPEPGTYALFFGLGALTVVGLRRRFRKVG